VRDDAAVEPTFRRTRTTDGVSIAYAVSGLAGGPALVLMPGVPFSNAAAEWQIPVLRVAFDRLGATTRFIQYDGRGTGGSQRDVDDLTLDAMLRDLDAVLDAERVGRVVLLGFYHSVMLALAWAARHRARAAGLVLFGGAARGWSPMSGAGTQALLSLIERDWDTFVESAAHAWLGWPDPELGRLTADWFRASTTPATARETMREASAIDVTDELSAIGCPVLVLHRADAPVIPLDMSRELAASLPDARLELLPGTSASLFFEDPEGVAARIAAFVATPSTDPPARPSALALRRPGRLDASGSGNDARLTPRELEVLAAIARGDTNGEIAAGLGISVNTVERHVSNVYRKIDARGRADATAWALRRGLA
jgi:pimeloyl-ACP methyl ester carboxylesterase/DNA-binding CsgD family transcriptional regulator